MKINRKSFISAAGTGLLAIASYKTSEANKRRISTAILDKAAARRVLNVDDIKAPVKIASIELFRFGNEHFVKTTSTDGAIGFAITNNRVAYLYPLLEQTVIPYFIGADARNLEDLIDGIYLFNSNYKLQGLALWCCVAWVEFSILDMLGKILDKPIGALLGGIINKEIPVYCASGNRNTSPQEEADILKKLVDDNGVKAVKFKVGGRMSNNADSILGRTESLIPLVRKVLGDHITIHADSNGSYDAPKAIEIGKMLEDIDAHFFEEPCPFDHLEDTRKVADALNIPIAGGECESSHQRFRWMIENNAVQVVQPDLHYYGGFIRSQRVARMAAAAGSPITLHMGGSGVGFVEVLQFASCTPNAGKFQEFKGNLKKLSQWYDPPLRLKDGAINIPEGPGMGINANPDFLQKARRIIPG